jgi:hypothetical protein
MHTQKPFWRTVGVTSGVNWCISGDNNAWWSIEEFVIDRKGLWKYMPYYRVGNGCVWDLAVALIVGFAIWRVFTEAALVPHEPKVKWGKCAFE